MPSAPVVLVNWTNTGVSGFLYSDPSRHQPPSVRQEITQCSVCYRRPRRIVIIILINDLLSAVANLICGVIQGSVIGPLMFLIYINDLVVLLSSFGVKVELFADDAKLYVKVVNSLAADELQRTRSQP